MGGNAGFGTSSSESKPLGPYDRAINFAYANQFLNTNKLPQGYQAPQYVQPSNAYQAKYEGAAPLQNVVFEGAGPAQQTHFQSAGPVQTAQYTDSGPVQAAQFTGAGPAQTLSGGDYQRLQDALLKGDTAGLDKSWAARSKEIDQNMSDRGIWSSGIAEQVKNKEYDTNWQPAYQKAAADATAQRYNLQSQEQQSLNGLNSQNAAMANQFGLSNAQMVNQGTFDRANAANNFGLANAQMQNQGSMDRANAANNFNQSDAARLDQYGLNAANQANTFGLSNAQMINQANTDRNNSLNSWALAAEQARAQQAQQNANAQNTFNIQSANDQQQWAWKPNDYLAGVWNGTGGQTSNSSAFNTQAGFTI